MSLDIPHFDMRKSDLDDEKLNEGPYRDGIWEAIAKNKEDIRVMKIEFSSVENAVLRFEKLTDGLSGDLRTIRDILETLNKTLITFDARIKGNEDQIKSLWAFPLKVAGAIIAIGGASAMVYGFMRWMIPALDINYPKN